MSFGFHLWFWSIDLAIWEDSLQHGILAQPAAWTVPFFLS